MTSTTQAPGSEHNFQQKVIRSGQPHWISWVVLTICTALIPVTWAYIEMTPNPPAFLAVIGLFVCAITIGGAVYMTVYQGQSYARLFQLFTNLSPTILLMSVFPFISGTLNSQSIGNSRELMVVLAVSVTVPWIASTVSMPVYEPPWTAGTPHCFTAASANCGRRCCCAPFRWWVFLHWSCCP